MWSLNSQIPATSTLHHSSPIWPCLFWTKPLAPLSNTTSSAAIFGIVTPGTSNTTMNFGVSAKASARSKMLLLNMLLELTIYFSSGSKTFLLNKEKQIKHTKVVCEVKPQKSYPHQTYITISGNHMFYPINVGTPTGSLELVNLLFNSVLSFGDTMFTSFDSSNFFLRTSN